MLTAIRAEKLFDGLTDQPLTARTVIIRNGVIEGVAEGDPALPEDAAVIDAPLLAPEEQPAGTIERLAGAG